MNHVVTATGLACLMPCPPPSLLPRAALVTATTLFRRAPPLTAPQNQAQEPSFLSLLFGTRTRQWPRSMAHSQMGTTERRRNEGWVTS